MDSLRDIEDLDQCLKRKSEPAVPQPTFWEEAQGIVPHTQKVFFKTFGCSHNISDSEVMLGLLAEAGYLIVEKADEADVWIVNSCTVKNPSQDAFQTWVTKARTAHKRLIVSGCVPQADRSLQWLEDVSIVGVTQIDRIVEVVEQTLQGNTVKLLSTKKLPSLLLPKVRKNKLVEIIPISTGCLGRCTFCKTKQARGSLVSYPVEDVVKRVQDACKDGVKDIWLTSEDSGAYGRDIKSSLPELLQAVLQVLPLDAMLRVGMTNPPYVLEHIKALSQVLLHPQVYEFLHVPVQSGSNGILDLMHREYRIEDFQKLIDQVQKLVPGVHICTDVICGFPSETETQHQETLSLLSKYRFPSVYISQFYPRPGTPAAGMTRVPTQVVKQRSREVTKLFESYTSYDHLLGTVQKVYLRDFEEEKDRDMMVGHTKQFAKVILKRQEELIGGSVYVRITETAKWHVMGIVTSPPAYLESGKELPLKLLYPVLLVLLALLFTGLVPMPLI